MHTLSFSFAPSAIEEKYNKVPSLMRAILTVPRISTHGTVYPFIVWVGDIIQSGNIAKDIRRLKEFAKRNNPGVEFEVSIPTAWIQTDGPK